MGFPVRRLDRDGAELARARARLAASPRVASGAVAAECVRSHYARGAAGLSRVALERAKMPARPRPVIPATQRIAPISLSIPSPISENAAKHGASPSRDPPSPAGGAPCFGSLGAQPGGTIFLIISQ